MEIEIEKHPLKPFLPPKAKLLMLDISKAKFRLGWEPRMNIEQCMKLVVDWYRKYQSGAVYQLCVGEINQYLEK